MPQVIATLSYDHLDEAKELLVTRYNAIVTRIIHTRWEGAVGLEQLQEYYEGDYVEDVQQLIAAGWTPMPAEYFTEDDWVEFADGLDIYTHNGGHEIFSPSPGANHDYKRWMYEPDEAAITKTTRAPLGDVVPASIDAASELLQTETAE